MNQPIWSHAEPILPLDFTARFGGSGTHRYRQSLHTPVQSHIVPPLKSNKAQSQVRRSENFTTLLTNRLPPLKPLQS